MLGVTVKSQIRAEQKFMRIAAVVGSMRKDSYTRKVLDIVVAALLEEQDVEVDVIDPAELELAFPGQEGAAALEKALAPRIASADGVVLSTPEYQGSYSSVLKVMIDNMGYPSALEAKPVALVGIAAGRIGAVKAIEHLHGVCAHVGALSLPYPVSVSEVHTHFDHQGNCADLELKLQLQGLAKRLLQFTRNYQR